MIDYSSVDQSPLIDYIFYPRRDLTPAPPNAFDIDVRLEANVFLSCRSYAANRDWPWLLYFHGNGEIARDYDSIAPLYHQQRLNLIVADYRGYGRSTGTPTMCHLEEDAERVFRRAMEEVRRDGTSPLFIMGRSLGSESALELACTHGTDVAGLVIESGFPSILSVVRHLGLPSPAMVDFEAIDEACLERVRKITVPALVIHGDEDLLVPLTEALRLFSNLSSQDKELVVIPHADHNSILYTDVNLYFASISRFVDTANARHIKG